jgi:hypothetical protein
MALGWDGCLKVIADAPVLQHVYYSAAYDSLKAGKIDFTCRIASQLFVGYPRNGAIFVRKI